MTVYDKHCVSGLKGVFFYPHIEVLEQSFYGLRHGHLEACRPLTERQNASKRTKAAANGSLTSME